MGAPTGSLEEEIVTVPRDTGTTESLPANPLIVIVAGKFSESRLIFVQVAVSGFHVLVSACSGVSGTGGPACGSISPICKCSPVASGRIPLEPSANETSTIQCCAAMLESRQRKVGDVISGGKTEPLSG